jgi:hypothetical protein
MLPSQYCRDRISTDHCGLIATVEVRRDPTKQPIIDPEQRIDSRFKNPVSRARWNAVNGVAAPAACRDAAGADTLAKQK